MKCVRGNQQTIYTIYVCHYHVQVYMLSHTGLHTITHRSTHYHIQVYTLSHTGLHTIITYRSACHITYRSTCRHKQVYTAMCFMLKIKHHQKWPWQASNPPLQCSGHKVVQANTHTHTHTHTHTPVLLQTTHVDHVFPIWRDIYTQASFTLTTNSHT